ncbi:MAG: thioredoxin family protein [Candidatus Synoicihabitans palmerolidicus]|nr:thioredoxin family protein [Candidatus Synoicihabitans palmerolidicus]
MRWFWLWIALATSLSAATLLRWETDLDIATERARTEGKLILIEFTGLSWVPPCVDLHEAVFDSAQFRAWTANMVLVSFDYPVRKDRTPAKIAANPVLAERIKIKNRFAIRGFPTLIVRTPTGEEIDRVVGYSSGMGTDAYLAAFDVATRP